MNRPEPIELENNLGPDAVTGEINRVPWMAYDVDEMDLYIAEKDKEIAELKKKLMPCLNGDCILTCEVVEKYGKENAELKQKLEDAKATAYTESVDAGMENRRLKRALFMAHSIKANFHWWWAYECLRLEKQMDEPRQWMIDRLTATQEACENSRKKCRAKAEEYK